MGVWTELVGVRRDLRLRAKWWHHVAVGAAVFSALIVYLIVAGAVVKRPLKLTTENTFSETLLHEATARTTTTTLSDLDALGFVGRPGAGGELVALQRPPDSDIRCENQARFKADETIKIGSITFRAIPDTPEQAPRENRHCVATAAYAGLSADSIAVYRQDGTVGRKQIARGFLAGVTAVMLWLIVYWNIYYRGFMTIYAKRRQLRKQRHFEAHKVR
jgi:hypothetical protein